jgi:flagellar assembly factor FliW
MSSSLAFAHVPTHTMTVSSDLLGQIEIDPSEILHFPAGLFGFPECRSFILLKSEQEDLYWLQSLEHSALTFLLLDPFNHFPGYSVELLAPDLRDLQARKAPEVLILAIVALPQTRSGLPTANLQGPLAINAAARLGKQLAISDSPFGLRCEFSLGAAAPA